MSIKHDLKSGVFYTALAKGAGVVVSLAVTAVLARIFTPQQFGTISIATVFISFFEILGNVGMGPAVIQNNELDSHDLDGIFSFTVWGAAILSVIFACVSFPISLFYDGGAELRNILLILTGSVFFNVVNMVPNALLMKAKRFKFAAIRALSVQIVTGALAIAAAFLGAGIYALTINPVLSSILIFIINYFQHPLKCRLIPGMASIRKVLDFSLFQFGFQLVNFFCRNLDRLLMGRYMGVTDIGYYDKASRLSAMPLNNITVVLSSVMHPVFAQIQDDKAKIADNYLKVIRLLAYIGFPLSVAMFFMSEDLIFFFFGDQWGASVTCLKIFCITIGIQMLSSSSGSIYQAVNDTKRLFGCGVFTGVTQILAVSIGVFHFKTIEGISLCICIGFYLNFLQCFYSLFVKSLHLGWHKFWKTLLGPLTMSVILIMVMLGLNLLLAPISNHFVRLVIGFSVSTLFVAAYIQIVGVYDLIGKIKRIQIFQH